MGLLPVKMAFPDLQDLGNPSVLGNPTRLSHVGTTASKAIAT